MPKTIAVTGGKGGTGKSTISTLLAIGLSKEYRVLLVDADADCPNLHIILKAKRKLLSEVKQTIPKWDFSKCIKCGKCSQVCKENAIVFVKGKYPIFVKEQCIGCNACRIICPTKAIGKAEQKIGAIYFSEINSLNLSNLHLISSEMLITYEETSPIVNALKKEVSKFKDKYDFVIIDTAAGTHCNVISALLGVDFALAVTEPTPLGAHDLSLILSLTKKLNIPAFVLLNKANMAKSKAEEIKSIATQFNTEIVSEIPYDKKIFEAYSSANLEKMPESLYKPLIDFIKKK
ncbi:P-loop ATPase [Candidatus Woesearchaeota archaeon]|nr:ATP-binding protein [Candidatus Woesearchaeota archaeon]RLE40584.1 MAG: P-loop ATPase [Candidatus Woesearchaeota archaeon]